MASYIINKKEIEKYTNPLYRMMGPGEIGRCNDTYFDVTYKLDQTYKLIRECTKVWERDSTFPEKVSMTIDPSDPKRVMMSIGKYSPYPKNNVPDILTSILGLVFRYIEPGDIDTTSLPDWTAQPMFENGVDRYVYQAVYMAFAISKGG